MAFELEKVAIKQNKTILNTKVEKSKDLFFNEGVDKILTTNSYSSILSVDREGNNVNIVGKTKVDIIYLKDEQIRTAFEDVEWNTVLDLQAIGEVVVNINNEKVIVKNGTQPQINLQVDLQINGETLEYIAEIKDFDKQIVVKRKEFLVENLVGCYNNTFNLTSELECDKDCQIICKNATLNVANVICGVDSYMVEGFVSFVIVLQQDENYKEIKHAIDFKQELPFKGLVPTNNIINSFYITTCVASINEGEEKNNIVLTLDIADCVKAYNTTLINAIEDAYAYNNEVVKSEECLSTVKETKLQSFNKQEVVAVELGDDTIEELIGVTNFKVENKKIENKKARFDLAFDVLYKSVEDGVVVKNCIHAFEYNVEDEIVTGINQVQIGEIYSKMKFNNEIEVCFNVDFSVLSENSDYVTYITELALGEPLYQDKSGFEVYLTKGNEDIFEIAKNLHVGVDVVKEQNPDIAEYQEGQHIIIYNQL